MKTIIKENEAFANKHNLNKKYKYIEILDNGNLDKLGRTSFRYWRYTKNILSNYQYYWSGQIYLTDLNAFVLEHKGIKQIYNG